MKQSFAPNRGFNFVIHDDFEQDLDELERQSEALADLAADISIYLDELREHPEQLARLLEDRRIFNTGSSCDFDIRELVEAKRAHYNLWRIRILDDENTLGAFRIIYAYSPTDRTFYVLGLMPRAVNYDLRHPQLRRILECYHDLGISKW